MQPRNPQHSVNQYHACQKCQNGKRVIPQTLGEDHRFLRLTAESVEQAGHTQCGECHGHGCAGIVCALVKVAQQECADGGDTDNDAGIADLNEEVLGQNGFVCRTGFPFHHVIGMGFQSQCNCRERVGKQIDKQQVDWRKRHRQPCQRAEQHGNDTCQIAGQQEQDCFLDVLVDVSAVLDCLDDGCKVIVRQYHRCRILGNLCTGDTHGNAHVCLFQRRGIVDAVTGHRNDIATFLPCPNNADLMLRRYTGIDGFICHKVHQLFVGVSVQCRTFYRLFRFFQNADFLGNRRRCDNVVAGNHYRLDASRLTLGNRLFGLFTRRVHFSDQSQIVQTVFICHILF